MSYKIAAKKFALVPPDGGQIGGICLYAGVGAGAGGGCLRTGAGRAGFAFAGAGTRDGR